VARIRSIKPEFPQSESIGRVSRDARLLFILLWTLCDDEGRLRGDSRFLARTLFPYDDGEEGYPRTTGGDVDRWMAELESERCVQRYSADGNSYIAVCNWLKHQKIDKPSQSKLPPPPNDIENPRESSRTLPVGGEGKGEEGRGEEGRGEEGRGEEEEAPGAADAAPTQASHVEHDLDLRADEAPAIPKAVLPTPAFQIPTNTGEEFPVYAEMIAEFRKAYPAVDVEAEVREMRAWSISNPKLRKTKAGMLRFINGWLAKEQDRSRPRPLAVRGRLDTPQSTDEYGRL
jgi:hypothetical protein